MEFPGVHFDREDILRLLNPATKGRSSDLAKECQGFVSKVDEFQSSVEAIFREMRRISASTDRHKMKAIGLRLKLLEIETEDATSKQKQETILLSKLDKIEKEIDRQQSYIERLLRAKDNVGEPGDKNME